MTSDTPPTPDPEPQPGPGPVPGPADPYDEADAPTRTMPAPEPRPDPDPSERGLYRSSGDRVLAGVCGGIAERYGFEAVLVRLVFIATLFLGGAGVLFYIAAAIVIPKPPTAADGTPLASSGSSVADAGHGVLRILVGLAIALAVLGGLFAVACVSFAVTVLLGAWPMAIVLAALGVLVAVNARSRRTTGTLLVLLLALAVPAAVAVAADVRVDRSAGQRTERPATIDEATAGYRLGMGTLTVDLRDLRPRPGQHVRIPVRVDLGEANVVLPRDRCIAWTVHTEMGIGGNTRVLDRGRSNQWVGDDERRTFRIDPSDTGDRPQVTLDVHVGAGEVAVVNSIAELDRLSGMGADRRSVARTDACRAKASDRP